MWSGFTFSSSTNMAGKHISCAADTHKCVVPTDNNVAFTEELDMDVYRGEVDGHSNFEWIKDWFWANLDALSHPVDEVGKGVITVTGNTLEDHYKPDIRTMDCLPLLMTKFIWSQEIKRMVLPAPGTLGGRKHTGDNYDLNCLSSTVGRAAWGPAQAPCAGANTLFDRFVAEWTKGVVPHNMRCSTPPAPGKKCSAVVSGSEMKITAPPTADEIAAGGWSCTPGCFWDCSKPITAEHDNDGKWRLGWYEVNPKWFDMFDDTKFAACNGKKKANFRSVRQQVLAALRK